MIYRQIAHKLRVDMGPGHEDFVSIRPRRKRDGVYLDLDDEGRSMTRVEFPDGARVDPDELVRIGAIEEEPRWRSPVGPPIKGLDEEDTGSG